MKTKRTSRLLSGTSLGARRDRLQFLVSKGLLSAITRCIFISMGSSEAAQAACFEYNRATTVGSIVLCAPTTVSGVAVRAKVVGIGLPPVVTSYVIRQ